MANSQPSALNFKSFSRSLEQFFLTVGHNNFGNKIPLLLAGTVLTSKRCIMNSQWRQMMLHFSTWRKNYKLLIQGISSLNIFFQPTTKGQIISKQILQFSLEPKIERFLFVFSPKIVFFRGFEPHSRKYFFLKYDLKWAFSVILIHFQW